jgi:hypothetical protein
MKPLHLYVKSKSWKRKIILISLYHNFNCMNEKNWRLSDTASYFHVSLGLVSENIKLFKNWDKVKNCANRKEALELIK